MFEQLKTQLKTKFPTLANPNLDNINYKLRKEQKNSFSFLFIVLKKLVTQLFLMPFYFLFFLPLAFLGFFKWLFMSKNDKALIKKYCEQFWYFPSLCIHKSIEGYLFSQLNVQSPSTDIGCEDGLVSSLHFPNVTFDLGVEYIKENLPTINIYRKVLQGGLPNLPDEMIGKYKTVCFVHVIDHIKDLQGTLQGLKKVMADDNSVLALSGFCESYQKNLKLTTLTLINEQRLNDKKGFWHFFTLNEWQDIFESQGFKVLKLEGFLGGTKGWLWSILHYFFETNGSNAFYYAANKLNLIPLPVKKLFCIFPVMCITAFFFSTKSSKKPCHFYAELTIQK